MVVLSKYVWTQCLIIYILGSYHLKAFTSDPLDIRSNNQFYGGYILYIIKEWMDDNYGKCFTVMWQQIKWRDRCFFVIWVYLSICYVMRDIILFSKYKKFLENSMSWIISKCLTITFDSIQIMFLVIAHIYHLCLLKKLKKFR